MDENATMVEFGDFAGLEAPERHRILSALNNQCQAVEIYWPHQVENIESQFCNGYTEVEEKIQEATNTAHNDVLQNDVKDQVLCNGVASVHAVQDPPPAEVPMEVNGHFGAMYGNHMVAIPPHSMASHPAMMPNIIAVPAMHPGMMPPPHMLPPGGAPVPWAAMHHVPINMEQQRSEVVTDNEIPLSSSDSNKQMDNSQSTSISSNTKVGNKVYERRNKKKRPADYYTRLEERQKQENIEPEDCKEFKNNEVAKVSNDSMDRNNSSVVSEGPPAPHEMQPPAMAPMPMMPYPMLPHPYLMSPQTFVPSHVVPPMPVDSMSVPPGYPLQRLHHIPPTVMSQQNAPCGQDVHPELVHNAETPEQATSQQTACDSQSSSDVLANNMHNNLHMEPDNVTSGDASYSDANGLCFMSDAVDFSENDMNTSSEIQLDQHPDATNQCDDSVSDNNLVTGSSKSVQNSEDPVLQKAYDMYKETSQVPSDLPEDIPSSTREQKEIANAASTGAGKEPEKSTEEKPKSAWGATTPVWSSLFKKDGVDKQSLVVYSEENSKKTSSSTSQNVPTKVAQVVVSSDKDQNAKQLGGTLLRHQINHKPFPLQPRGLVNRSNWCYINATLQALLACPPFYHLLKSLPSYPALQRGPSSTPVTDNFVEFANEFLPMTSKPDRSHSKSKSVDLHPGPCFEPDYIYKMLQVINFDNFKHGRQEDAEEFLSCVLNSLHDEMVAAMKIVQNEAGVVNGSVESSPETTEEVLHSGEDEEQWERVGPKNRSVVTRNASKMSSSPIAAIFGGEIRSTLQQYGSKSKESATLQPFFTLQLDIQSDQVHSVKTALEGFVSRESIHGMTCSKTKTEVQASRKILLEQLPPVLILHLKCFVYDKSGGIQKVIKDVEFDIDLDISKDLLSSNMKSKYGAHLRKYKLFAVVNHHGTKAAGGHYTADIFHPGINGWVRTDDSSVKVISLAQVLKFQSHKVPYLLYYRRADLSATNSS